MRSDNHDRYDVLVVGAGPGGLATAISAARHGARVLVVERRATTSTHPRATGISTRTMEIFRTWGIARDIRAGAVPVSTSSGVGETLNAVTLTPGPFPTPRAALAVSPSYPACAPQDHVEPLMVERLRRDGGRIRFDTELTELHTGPTGVRAVLTDRRGGTRRVVAARYVVGADGTRSTVRAALGIGVRHLGTMGEFAQVLFRADLDRVLAEPKCALYVVTHPEAEGLILVFGPDRWGYARQWFPERGESAADFTSERWVRLLRTATGIPDLRPELLGAASFTLAAELATAFQAGRGFLVGDAAHRTTPVAAVGMNTAIHDGHNLGWKLAWAARGLAGDGLPASYAEERYPVGLRNAWRSLRRGEPDPSDGMPGDLGSRYRSPVIDTLGDSAEAGREYGSPDQASAAPGERAPHVWVSYRGRRRSILDLFEGRITLLTGRRGAGWREAAGQLARCGVPVATLREGAELADPPGGLTLGYRLEAGGAVLVRPDGYVAWRRDTAAADPVGALAAAIDTALGHEPATAALAG